MTNELTSTCVWRISPDLIQALDAKFGEPLDPYVNGSQVWLRDDGPDGMPIEWRLHPVGGFKRPEGYDTYELFSRVALEHAQGQDSIALNELWDGLEAFSAYGDSIEPAMLAKFATAALGLAPDYCGMVDHGVIGDAWESSGGKTSIVSSLIDQLSNLG